MKIFSFFCIYFFALTFFTHAQSSDKNWDVNKVKLPFKQVEFNTDEGTWMNLDVSPDGKFIVFDLLGDIYRIPIAGGEATLLRGGAAWDIQPRYSPDGQFISFTSDLGGGDNIWVMKADGSDPRQITKENFRLLNNADWMPNGQYLVARKHFTGTRSLGAGEMWMYHISGGEGVQLTKRKNDQQDVNEPCVSPDGKYLYYSEDVYPGGFFQYNKDPNNQIYIIKRYEFKSGETESFITGTGGAMRPQLSNDGKYISFVRRIRTKSVLFVHRIETGEEWPIYDELTKDQQEAWAIFGAYTGYSWTPDDQHIIIWSNGKINKIQVHQPKTGAIGIPIAKHTIIPFQALCKHQIVDALRFKRNISPDEFRVKVIRQARTSPDEKMVVFNALGFLWKKEMPGGKAQRITKSTSFEFEPSFSPDGSEIVYVSWNDEQLGQILKYNFKTNKTTTITAKKSIYRTPVFSPDGKKIVFVRESGNIDQGFTLGYESGIFMIDADGKNEKNLKIQGESPVFNSTSDRIYYYASSFPNVKFNSVDLNGKDEKTIFTSKYATDFVISPDEKWIAFRELHQVYVAAFPSHGRALDLHAKAESVPLSRISKDAGINLHWSADSKKLHWTLGEEYFSTSMESRFPFLGKENNDIALYDSTAIRIGLDFKTDKPSGILVLKGARIITMKGNEVIENGSIVIDQNKIIAIGKTEDIKIPNGAKIISVDGKTIIPGIVDVHAHVGHFRSGITPQKHWPYYANLAYGVTTTHDPSTNTEMAFAYSELVKSGMIVGPRIFSTGTILYGADGDFKAVINSLDDARSAIRRTMAFGAFSVKSYNQPRREQRQMVIQAASELYCMVVPEGGSTFYHNMTMILDGHTGIEHNIPVAPVFKDVIQLWQSSTCGYTPTLIVSYGAVNGENYWYQKTNVWENERLLSYTPRPVIDSRSRHRTMIPDEEYENGFILASKSCKTLADAGVKVNLGAHGQLQGLGAHWELWMLVQGGMTAHEALRCATINGAHYIGMDEQIGSLEVGKLADLVILDKNPLESIYNSDKISMVMINGRLYDAATMNEIGNTSKARTKFYWELPNSNQSYKTIGESNSITGPKCVCGRH